MKNFHSFAPEFKSGCARYLLKLARCGYVLHNKKRTLKTEITLLRHQDILLPKQSQKGPHMFRRRIPRTQTVKAMRERINREVRAILSRFRSENENSERKTCP
jgi:hypothetical protein